MLRVENGERLFAKESGGHRWQRIPPNDTRPHSSTVTVAVMPEVSGGEFHFRECDLQISTCRGAGPGGQHKQKTETAVIVKHKPTGVTVRCQSERSQLQNKTNALKLLQARLSAAHSANGKQSQDDSRRQQVGTGMRADKIRTVQVRNGIVINHLTGRKCSLEKYLKGNIEAIA